jgi:hypothetical protein
MPCPTKELTIRQVAVLDCSKLLTPTPDTKAHMGFLTLLANTSLNDAPKTRKMPVRTVCVPQQCDCGQQVQEVVHAVKPKAWNKF